MYSPERRTGLPKSRSCPKKSAWLHTDLVNHSKTQCSNVEEDQMVERRSSAEECPAFARESAKPLLVVNVMHLFALKKVLDLSYLIVNLPRSASET